MHGVARLPYGVERDHAFVLIDVDALRNLLVAEIGFILEEDVAGGRDRPAEEACVRPFKVVGVQLRNRIRIVGDVHIVDPTGRVGGVRVERDGIGVRLNARRVGGVLIRFAVVLVQIGFRLIRSQFGVRRDLAVAFVPARDVIADNALRKRHRRARNFIVVMHLERTVGSVADLSSHRIVHRIGDRIGDRGILLPLHVEGDIVVKDDVRARRTVGAAAVRLGIPDRRRQIAVAVDALGERRRGPRGARQLGDAVRHLRACSKVAAVRVVGQGVRGVGHRDSDVGGQMQTCVGVLEITVEIVVAVRRDR